jgi:predicted nucleotidyltransferase
MSQTAALSGQQIEAATRCLEATPGVVAAYLHGSAVKGCLRPDSDVDIALLLRPHTDPSPAFRLELAAQLGEIFNRDVDLGLLSTRNLVYATQVAAHGQRLFTRDPLASDRFLAQAFAQYADLQRARKPVLAAYAA